MPPCTLGCSVFTRPPSISGHPVRSETSRTPMPASRSNLAVPPVETISIPSDASSRANSITPVLSYTLISARSMVTLPPVALEVAPQQTGQCMRLRAITEEGRKKIGRSAVDKIEAALGGNAGLQLDAPAFNADGILDFAATLVPEVLRFLPHEAIEILGTRHTRAFSGHGAGLDQLT